MQTSETNPSASLANIFGSATPKSASSDGLFGIGETTTSPSFQHALEGLAKQIAETKQRVGNQSVLKPSAEPGADELTDENGLAANGVLANAEVGLLNEKPKPSHQDDGGRSILVFTDQKPTIGNQVLDGSKHSTSPEQSANGHDYVGPYRIGGKIINEYFPRPASIDAQPTTNPQSKQGSSGPYSVRAGEQVSSLPIGHSETESADLRGRQFSAATRQSDLELGESGKGDLLNTPRQFVDNSEQKGVQGLNRGEQKSYQEPLAVENGFSDARLAEISAERGTEELTDREKRSLDQSALDHSRVVSPPTVEAKSNSVVSPSTFNVNEVAATQLTQQESSNGDPEPVDRKIGGNRRRKANLRHTGNSDSLTQTFGGSQSIVQSLAGAGGVGESKVDRLAEASSFDQAITESRVSRSDIAANSVVDTFQLDAEVGQTSVDPTADFQEIMMDGVDVAEQVINQTVDSIRSLEGNESKEIRVQLSPEQLGEVDVRVTASDDAIKAQIVAAEPAAVELLIRDKAALITALQELGIEIENIDIQHQESGGFEQRESMGQSRDDETMQQTFDLETDRGGLESESKPRQPSTSSGNIDVVA